MSRPRNPIPNYRLHKQSGQAIVTIRTAEGGRKDVLLGPHGSPESMAEYERVIGQLRVAGPAAAAVRPYGPSVNEVVLAFLTHAAEHYRRPDGTRTKEFVEYKSASRVFRKSHGHTPAAEFGPLGLTAVRQAMIDAGWCRPQINKQVGRVRRVFKWAAARELVPGAVYQNLEAVEGLRRGRSAAADHPPVVPAPAADVAAALAHMTPTLRAMVELQWLAGMRPVEVRVLTPGEVDRSGPVWVYRPGSRQAGGNKMAHLDRDRAVYLGPKAAAVLAPWLEGRGADERVFTPKRSKEEWWAMMRAKRKSRPTPSELSRRKPPAELVKPWRDRWTDHGYAAAVAKACARAGVAPFAPNRVRHAFATDVRAKYGLEAAQVLLGHAKADVTQVYAERDAALALKVAAEAG